MGDEPFCARCHEEFPVSKEPATWGMGTMRRLEKAPAKVKAKFPKNELNDNGNYLCGNCYFDLTDDD